MKYLKFLSQNNISPLGDYFQSNFTFVVYSSIPQVNKYDEDDIKKIEVRLSGREDASLRALNDNYELEAALFTIARNYIIEKIETEKEIKNNEKLYPDASEYLNLDSEPLEKFHCEVIEIEV